MGEPKRLSVNLAADVVILSIRDHRLEVLLIRRGKPPFEGELAIPGGFLEEGENLLQAAERELREETALDGLSPLLEEVGTYSDPDRDPRGRVVSVVFVAMVPDPPLAQAGGDAAAAQWTPVDRALSEPLAFDHHRILSDAVDRARRLFEHTTAAAAFCQEEFTITELRRVYETVWRTPVDPGNFHRRVTRIEGFLEATGRTTTREGGRPAALYRAEKSQWLRTSLPRAEVVTGKR